MLNGKKTLTHSHITTPLVKAIRELKADNDAKDLVIDDLTKRISALESK